MIKSKNIFFITLLANFLVVKSVNNFYLLNILKKKKKIRINTKIKCNKKKNILINTTPQIFSIFFSLNNSVHLNKTNFIYSHKRVFFLFKWKLKWTFKKIKYRGKGFKVKKFNRLSKLTFRLGRSHWTKLKFNPLITTVRRTKKNSYCFICVKNKMFNDFEKLMKKIKGINKYTKRGLRLTRQVIIKRFGKVSQASSIFDRY